LRDVASAIDGQANRLVVLDLRNWSLLNGDDGKSRSDVCRIFGLGEEPLVVDNASSCVVAAANTYQRRYAVQAAQEVLTWRLVAAQVVEEEERADVQRKLAEAESKLKDKIRGAFRHFMYLTRKGQQLEVIFARFDDDKQTALAGNDVWGALVTSNRAVGEYFDTSEKRKKRSVLSEVFAALLLEGFDRHLTLKDVVSSFYKDPRFPLVPTLDEIRQVIFNLLQPANHAGSGTGGWELVGSDGVALHIQGPKQLAISSVQQQLRRKRSADVPAAAKPESDPGAAESIVTQTAIPFATDTTPPHTSLVGATKASSFSWYKAEVINRSITDETKREAIRAHLIWLATKLDDDTLNHQLFTLRYELMASSDAGLAADLKARALAIQAGRVSVEEEM
jgi:hypothetical protein